MVDRVEADLMLGFFFPGATMISTARPADPAPTTAAPAGPSVPVSPPTP
jgi:hypothetical protein